MVSFRFLFVGTALLAAPVMAAFRESEQLIKNLDGVTEQIDAMQAMAEAADFSQPMSTDEEDDFTVSAERSFSFLFPPRYLLIPNDY